MSLALGVLAVVVATIFVHQSPAKNALASRRRTATTIAEDDTETLPPGTLPPTTVDATSGTSAPMTPPEAAAGSGCRSGNPLADVYHPDRLQVVTPCAQVSGVVETVRHEDDGDYHFDIALDPPDASYVNPENAKYQDGWLVAEIVPADEPGCTPGRAPRPASGTYDYGICTGADLGVPTVGSHVTVTGPYVIDHVHGWAEVHPVWRLSGQAAQPAPPSPPQASARPTEPSASGATCSARMSSVDVSGGAHCESSFTPQ